MPWNSQRRKDLATSARSSNLSFGTLPWSNKLKPLS
jgi:hypothetical protein